MLTDETNRQPSDDVKFFVYGGLALPIEAIEPLHRAIAKIRQDSGYLPGDEFKFDTRSRPENVSIETSGEAKRQVIQACRNSNCVFFVHVILHKIIAKQDPVQQIQWAADYVISRFNMLLGSKSDTGICVIDNLPERGQFQYLTDKFQHGLHLPDGDSLPLDRIRLYAATTVGAGHVNSAMDIVLGAFRYCINNPKNPQAASEMLSNLVPMMWGRRENDVYHVLDRGLILRPPIERISNASFREEYKALIDQINELLHVLQER
ncbi:MAG: hypothetical protein IH953_07765 [Chloroflexi bacterium]|nr:hypothetical protein [Chloroflexota bacterium]